MHVEDVEAYVLGLLINGYNETWIHHGRRNQGLCTERLFQKAWYSDN